MTRRTPQEVQSPAFEELLPPPTYQRKIEIIRSKVQVSPIQTYEKVTELLTGSYYDNIINLLHVATDVTAKL
jgi:chromosomal replication initiation ATPase DnaA